MPEPLHRPVRGRDRQAVPAAWGGASGCLIRCVAGGSSGTRCTATSRCRTNSIRWCAVGAIQRLRHISQNSRAVAGFPSMTGTRYEHALGTMHLAVRAWRSCWQHTIPPSGIESADTQKRFQAGGDPRRPALPDRDPITEAWVGSDGATEDSPLWDDFERRIGLVLGAVGLLHDVGHPPFSHVLEPFYARHLTGIFGASASAAFDGLRRDCRRYRPVPRVGRTADLRRHPGRARSARSHAP